MEGFPPVEPVVHRKTSQSTESFPNEKHPNADIEAEAVLAHDEEEVEGARARRERLYQRFRPFILGGLAAVILGWWISSIVLKATRHRWYVKSKNHFDFERYH